jgi:hypothetical protein
MPGRSVVAQLHSPMATFPLTLQIDELPFAGPPLIG